MTVTDMSGERLCANKVTTQKMPAYEMPVD